MARWETHRSDGNQAAIIQALERVGATVEVIGRPVDLLVGYRGKNYVFEVKTARGQIRQGQRDFLDRWKGQAAVVRSVEAALAAIGVAL